MTEHDAFLRAIRDHPADDTARLVFADWLADRGDPDRGDFIRIEVELARRDPDDEAAERRRPALFARRAELLKAHRQGWIEPFLPHARDVKFERGFVSEIEAPADAFLAHGGRWLALTPLARIRFTTWNATGPRHTWRAEELLASPLLSELEMIGLGNSGVTATDVEVLARHPDLARLRELHLGGNRLGPDGAMALAGMPQLAGLESLNLVGNGIADAGARAVAESPHLARLKELWIDHNQLRKRTWAVLEHRFGEALMG